MKFLFNSREGWQNSEALIRAEEHQIKASEETAHEGTFMGGREYKEYRLVRE